MVINKPSAPKTTIPGEHPSASFFGKAPAPQAAPQPDIRTDAFNALLNLNSLCQQKEREFMELANLPAQGAVRDPDGASINLVRGVADEVQKLIDSTNGSEGRARVARAARREGMVPLNGAVASRERSVKAATVSRINQVAEGLKAQVALNPARLRHQEEDPRGREYTRGQCTARPADPNTAAARPGANRRPHRSAP